MGETQLSFQFVSAEIAADTLSLDEIAECINGCQQQIGHGLRYSAIQVVQSGAYLTAAKTHQEMKHGMWLPWLAEKCPEIKQAAAYRYIALYEKAKSNLSLMVNLTPTQAYKQLGIIKESDNIHFSSDSSEWYTPETIIKRTQKLFGGSIQLDPCSNDGKKPNVPAETIFTKDDDGLQREWFGTVYMNPPYGRIIEDWVEKLCSEYEAGRVRQAIALIPARTDTAWFRRMVNYPRLFIWGRLQFSGHENSAPFPSMIVYLGNDIECFRVAFSDIGDIYVRA